MWHQIIGWGIVIAAIVVPLLINVSENARNKR